MSTATLQRPAAVDFGTALLNHLEDQLGSARRLLDAVLRQGKFVRARNVEGVLACLAEVQAEMERRSRLEAHRAAVLDHAAKHLDIPIYTVTIDHLVGLIGADQGAIARDRSHELRGLLNEVSREHATNRVLMRQEMAFLDHLTRLIGGEAQPGYRPPDDAAAPQRPVPTSTMRLLDLQA